MNPLSGFSNTLRGNLSQARFSLAEFSGALGDLGTFLPLLVAMSQKNGLDFAAALFFAGALNIVTGLTFGIPMAIQPMKAIAAVALVAGLSEGEIRAAGMCVSAVVLLLSATGMVDKLGRFLPAAAIRGLQAGLGLTLLVKAFQMALAPGAGALGAPLALVGLGVLLLGLWLKRLPVALVLFVLGLGVVWVGRPAGFAPPGLMGWRPHWVGLGVADFPRAFTLAALPQMPLTLLNSGGAVCALSMDLCPGKAAPLRKVGVSVGLMNLLSAPFGAMPMCHGAGGLAAQWRFGARTGGSVMMLGGVKMLLAVVFGGTLMSLCAVFPAGLLGVMLAVSGTELLRPLLLEKSLFGKSITALTAVVCVAGGNMLVGLGAGLVLCALARRGADWLRHPGWYDSQPLFKPVS